MTAAMPAEMSRVDLADLIGEVVDAHPDEGAQRIAELVTARVPQRLYRSLLLGLVEGEVSKELRYRTHRVEQQARRRPSSPPPAPERPALSPITPDVTFGGRLPLKQFRRLYVDPGAWGITGDESVWWFGGPNFAAFRRWCDDNHADAGGFEAWLDRGILMTADDPEDMDDWQMAWVPDRIRKMARDLPLQRAIGDMIARTAERIRFDVTAELLGSAFAVGDGTQVTWRDATVEQHRDRIELLTKMAAGTAETAAMHLRAVHMIEDAGADSLGELTGEAAA